MIRVSDDTHRMLRELSSEMGESMQDLVAEAVDQLRRRWILHQTNAAYAVIQDDPERWAQELADRAEWDTTLADGLDAE